MFSVGMSPDAGAMVKYEPGQKIQVNHGGKWVLATFVGVRGSGGEVEWKKGLRSDVPWKSIRIPSPDALCNAREIRKMLGRPPRPHGKKVHSAARRGVHKLVFEGSGDDTNSVVRRV